MANGVEVGMKFETRKAMQKRYAKRVTCPSCADPDATRFPNGRIACEKDCDDND